MIARSFILFLLLDILPFVYFYLRFFHKKAEKWKQVLLWIPCVLMVAYTIYLAMEPNFIPDNDRILILYFYLLLIGLVIAPMWIFILCSLAGRGCSALVRKFCAKDKETPRRNYGNFLGLILIPVVWFIVLWGAFPGFNKFEVNHTEYESEALPEAFDGYRIVIFSDAHVGSYQKRNTFVLEEAIDSMNAQKPDMIVFTGDLQNIQPADLYPHIKTLSKLKAKDGVFSILGNHDYAEYLGCDEAIKAANIKETISLEKQLGWTLLLNENRRRKIIPDGRAQLTLSGHTHAMQFNILGWCPMSVLGREFWGWYEEGHQKMFVTAGLGGLIPFRFGATGEIVILTLKKK